MAIYYLLESKDKIPIFVYTTSELYRDEMIKLNFKPLIKCGGYDQSFCSMNGNEIMTYTKYKKLQSEGKNGCR